MGEEANESDSQRVASAEEDPARVVATGDASTDQQDLQQDKHANEPDSRKVTLAQEGPAEVVATGDASTEQQDQKQNERAKEPDSQSVAQSQEGLASAEAPGTDRGLTTVQGSVIAETQSKSDAPTADANTKQRHQVEAEEADLP